MKKILAIICFSILNSLLWSAQPPVAPGPNEPNWSDVLNKQFGLDMDRDLRNPLTEEVAPAALFIKADADRPVLFTPIIALGTEKMTHGGWYPAGPKAGEFPAELAKAKIELWSYAFKQPAELIEDKFSPPPLTSQPTFDPGKQPFGLWVSNDEFNDGGVYSQPAAVAKLNERLRSQPYKAMIYPTRDKKTGDLITNSYLIGWEYSTNDDFQDVVTRIDNVRLLQPDPMLKGILKEDATVKKLHNDFKFVEGPAWDAKKGVLYFSDIPPAHIVAFEDSDVKVVNQESGMSNGLMLDKQGSLVRCEHKGRRVSRGPANEKGETIVAEYKGKRLNSPNDLWIDEADGIYFTDPRYGSRDDLEQDKEAVYYVSADGKIERIIDDLVRPNGIALSPTGKALYVVDNGANALHRYTITAPGKIEKGERIASVTQPDGMTVDKEGRLYVTCLGGVWVLDANGKWIGLIETPEQPANCTFGGKDYATLFITARTSLYSIDTLTRGWHVHLDGQPEKK
jgi:gluconolactonase